MAPLARICLIGAESTGKSHLAHDLARHFGGVVVPEFAREYGMAVARPLTVDDVETIARGQIANEDHAHGGLVILDTDLVSTVAYSIYYYRGCPQWIVDAARQRLADLYLFLHADVPWIEDPVRDVVADRAEVHAVFHETLERLGARYVSISGKWDDRKAQAIAAIQAAR